MIKYWKGYEIVQSIHLIFENQILKIYSGFYSKWRHSLKIDLPGEFFFFFFIKKTIPRTLLLYAVFKSIYLCFHTRYGYPEQQNCFFIDQCVQFTVSAILMLRNSVNMRTCIESNFCCFFFLPKIDNETLSWNSNMNRPSATYVTRKDRLKYVTMYYLLSLFYFVSFGI